MYIMYGDIVCERKHSKIDRNNLYKYISAQEKKLSCVCLREHDWLFQIAFDKLNMLRDCF